MKKLFFIIAIFFLSITTSFAIFFIEGQGNYTTTSESDPILGVGTAFGFDLTDDINLLVSAASGEVTQHRNKTNEVNYEFEYAAIGIEFIPQIAVLDKYRLNWRNSVNIGASRFNTEHDNYLYESGDGSEMGTYVGLKTGMQFNFTQCIAPYFDLNFHKTFPWSTDPKVTVQGWQAALGIRLYFGGSRDYDTGY